ncbi:hypothetical protein BU26DRAFT_569248 [Trematosphaeria pertusa]|uniref:MIF4G domain-containing protein n=1 Tax=Trematosphaeria pertusa TaxID=390896 RepID=A0A6A6I268_9PLEO|nr:uncharacterized protein BU26DRAFT_569248 [Trematosphaeria pertusa]KAF2244249.1 hypothetical protein BU26DRAFT_569248 [Trematosphaeria pertusa]
MSASISNALNPPIAAAQTAAAANSPSPGPSSANVAAGSAQQPTARSSYANATKKTSSSPPIASSGAPPVVAVGGPHTQHGKSSISPVNGSNPIKPAVPAMAPTIVNSSGVNGAPSQGDHSRKSSVTISAAGASGYMPNGTPVTSRAPSGLTFGSMAGSPAPSHPAPNMQGGLNPQMNPRIASPAHSPSPIPAPVSGGKPETLPTRPGLGGIQFGGGSDSGEPNSRPISLPPQPNVPPVHMRRESSQSAHSQSDMSNRGFPNGGRGRGGFNPGYNPQMGHPSPQPYRPIPNQAPRGPGMPPAFQPQMGMNSPYRANRSPALTPAQLHQQAHQGMPFYPPQYSQQVRIPSSISVPPSALDSISKPYQPVDGARNQLSQSPLLSASSMQPQFRLPRGSPIALFESFDPFSASYGNEQYLTELQHQNMYGMPQPGLDPYNGYYGQSYGGLQQSIHAYPGVPASPGRGHAFPQQPYQVPYGQPPQAQGMTRTPSNMSERPPSAVPQPQTPAMTNVNAHVSHTHTPSATSGSPAPNASTFAIPPKKSSKAIVIKTADGEIIDFNKKASSPAPPAVVTQPPKSPVVVASPTPPPRSESTHSRTESIAAKTDREKQADFVAQFKKNLEAEKQKEEAEKKAAAEAEAQAKAEAEAKAQKEKEEADAKAAKEKEEAEKAAKEKEAAEAAAKAEAEAAEKKRLEEEEMERMIAEMEAAEKEEEERMKVYEEKKKREAEERKAHEAERIAQEEEKLRQQEREAEAAEEARARETPEQKAERESLFASLKKNTQFGPAAMMHQETGGASTPPVEPAVTPPAQPKTAKKPAPAALKIPGAGTPIEPAQPTAAMQSLKSARFLEVKKEMAIYPNGIQSPNPALNLSSKGKGRQYDKDFLLQFQDVFKEKPSVDWDMKLKETVGDSTDSARPQSARAPSMMGPRQSSRPGMGSVGPMGSFQGIPSRTLPPGTTSEQRFREASSHRGPMTNPLAQFVAPPRSGAFPIQMQRNPSFQNMSHAGPGSPRVGSSGGKGNSRRGPKGPNRKEEAAMPLTAGQEVKGLERSTSGWQPPSRSHAAPVQLAGHMAPDMVQRKVKAALNKMTPEKFDKISDQILEIAAQSKDESDGRTLRQVIQLTFEKACDEQHWSSMYAKFCHRMLATMSPDIKDENVRDKHGNPVVGGALFRKYLLNRCQEEFEKGWEVNLPDKPEGQEGKEAALLSDEYYIAAAAKRRGLGLIQFIGELYKLGMLTLRIMHECVLKLLDFEGLPDESAIESLAKLLRTVGATMHDTDTGPKMLNVYFERIEKIMNMDGLPSRLKFMLLDLCDLRRAGWKSKEDNKGPKTLAEIHQEAVAAQQAAEMERTRSQRGPRMPMGRGDARSFSGGGFMPPQDYPTGRVQMDDLRKLSKGASGRAANNPGLGPSMLGSRSGSGRRGLGPGSNLMGRGDDSGASSRTGTPPVQKDKESTSHANSFSALMNLDNEGAGEVGSPPSTASSPPQSKSIPARSKSPATEGKATKASE